MSLSRRSLWILIAVPILSLMPVSCTVNLEIDRTEESLEEFFEKLDEHQLFHGTALVVDDDEIAFTKSYGMASYEWEIPNSPAIRYRIGSLSKQFAAMIVLQLADEGLLSLDDPLAKHLPALPRSWAGTVTVHHVLSQTSGIPDYAMLPDYIELISRKRFTRDEFFEIICRDTIFTDPQFPAGESWAYSNTNYFLLGVLAERVAGEPYEQLVQKRIFDPLEMGNSGVYDSLNPVRRLASGYEILPDDSFEKASHMEMSPKSVPSGGLYSTVGDLLKWSRALREGRLASSAMMKVFTTPTLYLKEDLGYACGNWRELRETQAGDAVEVFSHGGSMSGTSTWLLRVPSKKRCVVLLHNGGMGREGLLEKISLSVLDILDGEEAKLPKLDLIGSLANTYFSHRELLVDHYHMIKEKHGDIYDLRPEELSQMGQLLIGRIGDTETALTLFRLNVEEYPASPLAHADLGGLLLEMGSTEEALKHLLRARELRSEPDEELEALIKKAKQ